MTKPPIPDNPISDFMNSTFTGSPDSSLLAMVLVSTLLVGVYLLAAASIRRKKGSSGLKNKDLAFALTIATPLTSIIVLGPRGLPGGLICAGFTLVIGLYLTATSRTGHNQDRKTVTDKIR